MIKIRSESLAGELTVSEFVVFMRKVQPLSDDTKILPVPNIMRVSETFKQLNYYFLIRYFLFILKLIREP